MFLLNYWLAILAFIAPLFDLATAQSNGTGTAGAYFAITGVQTGINDATGELPVRKNILDLQNDQPAWYVQSSPYALCTSKWLTCVFPQVVVHSSSQCYAKY